MVVIHFESGLVPAESVLICGVGWLVFWYGLKLATRRMVQEPLGRGSGSDQDQPSLVPGLRSSGRSYKMICSWLPLLLTLEVLGKSYLAH